MSQKSSAPHEKIRLKGLEKAFGEKKVLTGVDLSLNQGESLVVIGGSGSGKSVLLKCILGLLKPTSGKIFIDEKDVFSLNSSEKEDVISQIGMLFQGGALFDSLTVWQNVSFDSGTVTSISKIPFIS